MCTCRVEVEGVAKGRWVAQGFEAEWAVLEWCWDVCGENGVGVADGMEL